jgi:hypothetical protein
VYNLWPATTVTARIVAINGMYDGPPSVEVIFTTSEGGKFKTDLTEKQKLMLYGYGSLFGWQLVHKTADVARLNFLAKKNMRHVPG